MNGFYNMKKETLFCGSLLCSLLLSNVAKAEGWSGEAEVGYIKLSGNTSSENLNLGLDFKHENERWTNSVNIQAFKASSDDIEFSNNLSADFLLERAVTKRSKIFFSLGYLDDDFDGFTEQRSASLGYGYEIFDTKITKWELGTGVGYRDTELISFTIDPIDNSSIPSSSLSIDGPTFVLRSNFEHQLTETTLISDNFRGEFGSDNSFVENEASVQFLINSKFSFKLSLVVRHNTDPAEQVEKTDTLTIFSLVYSLDK
jgi:putative salt-induced outer membrane protein